MSMVPLPYEQVRDQGVLVVSKGAVAARGGGNGSLVGPGGPFGCAVASVSSPPSFPSSVAAVAKSTLVAERSGPPHCYLVIEEVLG